MEVVQVALSDIRALKETYWFGLGAPPIMEYIVQHAKQIFEADISYPIIVCSESWVMVGMHRVCKASIDGHKFISAVRLTELQKPDYIGKKPDELPY
jgi:hypothetical protein